MPQVQPPEPKPMLSDIQLFAKAYFNIELTTQQMEFIAMVAAGKQLNELRISRRAGLNTANKVIRAYLQEGVKIGGRMRLPQHPLPPREKPAKGVTHAGRILAMIKRPGGAYNFELARIALKYDARIHELRADGHDIICERQYLKNGRASNTFRYRLAGQ